MKNIFPGITTFIIVTLIIFIFFGFVYGEATLGFLTPTLITTENDLHAYFQKSNSYETFTELPNNESDCKSMGGKWSDWDGDYNNSCQIPAKDAGEICMSGFQCSYGKCITNDFSKRYFLSGKCLGFKDETECIHTLTFGMRKEEHCGN